MTTNIFYPTFDLLPVQWHPVSQQAKLSGPRGKEFFLKEKLDSYLLRILIFIRESQAV